MANCYQLNDTVCALCNLTTPYQTNIYNFAIPSLASAIYSVRKLVSDYAGATLSISRISDNSTALVFTDSDGQITRLEVQNPAQTITSLSDIKYWLNLNLNNNNINIDQAIVNIWYDHTPNSRHLIPEFSNSNPPRPTFKLMSDRGRFPCVYITNNAYLTASIGTTTVSQFSAAIFADFSERVSFSGTEYALIGVASTTSHTTLFKSFQNNNFV